MKKSRKKNKVEAITQCERCANTYCRNVNECGRKEFEAIARGERYECEDFEALSFHERMAA